MKFLLVMPRFVSATNPSYIIPLGLPYISATLKSAGHQVDCVNLNEIDGNPEDIVGDLVRELDPDVCGSSALSPHMPLVRDIFAASRRAKPGIVNIVGGGVLSSAPELVPGIINIDIGVIGEGEITIIEICEALENGGDLKTVDGIVCRDGNGGWVRTPARTPNKDLDALPWPDFDGFMADKFLDAQNSVDDSLLNTQLQPRSLSMVTSRSCPFSCTFCFHPSGRVYRNRGFDDFFGELDHLIERYDINMITILDELFAIKRSRLIGFCERIKPYDIKWGAQLHVGIVDEEVIDALAGAGCSLISYGLESINDDILVSMQKKTTQAKIEHALELTYDRKIIIQGNFIFGDSAETMETANYTANWWANNLKYRINLSYLQVFHGTRIYQEALEKGLIEDKVAHYMNPALNVARFDDCTYTRMQQRISVLHQTIFTPTEILAFEQQPGDIGKRGRLFHVDWKCPRCGTTNDYRDIPFDVPGDFQKKLLTCRGCYSRFDVRNLARPNIANAELDEIYGNAVRLHQQGDLKGAAALYERIISRDYMGGRYMNRPDAHILALFDLGKLFLDTNQPADIASYYLAEAVFYNCYAPAYHLTYANALLKEGSVGAAILHFRQAGTLAAGDDTDITDLANKMVEHCLGEYDPARLQQYFH